MSNPIQSNVNKRAQVFLFARIFYNITFTYKLKHVRFQLTRSEHCREHIDQASVCLDDFWKYRHQPLNLVNCSMHKQKENFLKLYWLALCCNIYLFPIVVLRALKLSFTATQTSLYLCTILKTFVCVCFAIPPVLACTRRCLPVIGRQEQPTVSFTWIPVLCCS